MKIETLRWFNNRLEMIDQRILPAAFEYLSYYTAHSVAEGIRSMVVRGAPAIGVAAAYGVALEAQHLQEKTAAEFKAGMEEGFKVLAASRPTRPEVLDAVARDH